LITLYVVRAGIKVFGLDFLTQDIPFSNRLPGGGMNAAIVGTLVITGTATAMAVPLGVLGGIYLNEYGGSGVMARIVRFLADVMTGVPSVVLGLFLFTILGPSPEGIGAQRLRRRPRAGVPHAPDRDPHDGGDPQGRPRGPTGGELRARMP